MNKSKKNKSVLITGFLWATIIVQAQDNTTTSFHNIQNTSGSITYSIGQIAINTAVDIQSNSIAEGVHQPYEIATVLAVKNETMEQLELIVYPNPTSSSLNIEISNFEIKNGTYTIFDNYGRKTGNGMLNALTTTINIENYQAATYYIEIYQNKTKIKTFTVIKL